MSGRFQLGFFFDLSHYKNNLDEIANGIVFNTTSKYKRIPTSSGYKYNVGNQLDVLWLCCEGLFKDHEQLLNAAPIQFGQTVGTVQEKRY